MKVLLQWAQHSPRDWIEVDAAAWAGLAKRPVPLLGELGGQDADPGWLACVNVQGVMFNGADHVAVEPLPGDGVRVTSWWDDPEDYPIGERRARVWTFLPLAPDPTFGSGDRERLLAGVRNEPGISEGKRSEVLAHLNDPANYPINTRQSQVVYAEAARFDTLLASPPQNTAVRPWSEFVAPAEEITRHGVWQADEKYAAHVAARSEWGWRHWCDHLPASETEIDPRGRRELRGQREQGRYAKATRTITYYQRDTNLAQGWATATHEDELQTTTAGTTTESVTTDSGVVQSWAFASPSGSPNSTNWDGVYHVQLDCTAASGGLIYVVGTGGGTMFVVRLSSDLSTSLASAFESATNFSGTGLKLFTSGSETWTSPAAADRFGFKVTADGDSHGDAITLRLNGADSYADGPWTAEVVPPLILDDYADQLRDTTVEDLAAEQMARAEDWPVRGEDASPAGPYSPAYVANDAAVGDVAWS